MAATSRTPAPTQPAIRSGMLLAWDRPVVLALAALLLGGGLFLAYANTFQVPFLLDDDDSIRDNATIRSFATALFPPTDSGVTVSGRPLLNLSLAINHHLGGTDVFSYHLGNLLIHFAAALCLFGVVRRTLRQPTLAARFGAHATPLAWLASALWALHPLQTGAVTYIIQRAESLVGLCYLFTLHAFIRAVEKSSRPWAIAAGLTCFLGMAAKEVMASAPLVLFLYDRTFVSGTFRGAWRRHRRLHLTFAASWLLLLALVITSGSRGATVGFGAVPWLGYVSTQAVGVVTYLWEAVYPANLIFDYGAVIETRPSILLPGIAVLLFLLGLTALLLRKRPAAGFLGAWFFLILAPTSSIIPVATQTLAEHRMYLPLAAIAVATVVLAYRLSARLSWSLVPLLVLACGVATVERNRTYRDPITLWEDTVRKAPANARAWSSLGVAYLEAGRMGEAIRCLSEAADRTPQAPAVHLDLANGYTRLNRLEDAVRHYEIAISLAPHNAEARLRLGGVLRRMQRLPASVATLREAAALQPDSPPIRSSLGVSLLASGRVDEALYELGEAVRLDPGHAQARYYLGDALAEAGRLDEAIVQMEALLALPDPPGAELLSNLGVLYARTGRIDEAIGCMRRALEIDPNHAGARDNLAKLNAFKQSQPGR